MSNLENHASSKPMCVCIKRFAGRALFLAAALLTAQPGNTAQAPVFVGFKELQLGMSYRTVSSGRPLNCTSAKDRIPYKLTDVLPAARKLKAEVKRLEDFAFWGEQHCVARRMDTIGGMPISELRVSFLDKALGKIDISIHETGTSYADGRGGSNWSSGNLTTLAQSLDSRFGPHEETKSLMCGTGGRCRNAPYERVMMWQPDGGTVTLTYTESTVNTAPSLIFVSKEFVRRQKELRDMAAKLALQVDAIERAAIEKKNTARSKDL